MAVMSSRLPRPVPSPSPTGADRIPRLSGLDGLRAVAVSAVLLFHVDAPTLSGGFLGVDLFFVISGFLITQMLLREIVETGGLRLVDFYQRRVRRLFPAVAVLLLVVIAGSTTSWPEELPRLQRWCGIESGLRHQLVVDLSQRIVLRQHGPTAHVAAPLVVGHRGAVLPDLAGGDHAAHGGVVAPGAAR